MKYVNNCYKLFPGGPSLTNSSADNHDMAMGVFRNNLRDNHKTDLTFNVHIVSWYIAAFMPHLMRAGYPLISICPLAEILA